MLQIIAGGKGKGKTKFLLKKANDDVQTAKGSVVYLDKSRKHMHELSNKVRLIDISDYPVRSYDAFIGFVCGIISQDYDIETLYVDSFLKLASLEGQDIAKAIEEIAQISDKYNVNMILSISSDENLLPDNAKEKLIVSL